MSVFQNRQRVKLSVLPVRNAKISLIKEPEQKNYRKLNIKVNDRSISGPWNFT